MGGNLVDEAETVGGADDGRDDLDNALLLLLLLVIIIVINGSGGGDAKFHGRKPFAF